MFYGVLAISPWVDDVIELVRDVFDAVWLMFRLIRKLRTHERGFRLEQWNLRFFIFHIFVCASITVYEFC